MTPPPSNAPSSPALAVVIVNYLAYDHLERCLESLLPFVAPGDEVVVVDHQAQPQSLDRLARRFPGGRFIAVPGNPGFAAGVNRGVRETATDYVLLLNPDCIVTSDPRPLAAWLAAHSKAAVCGGIVRESDGTIQASARRFPGITTGFAGRTSWLTRLWPGNPFTARNLVSDRLREPIQVDWVSGACMMVRRAAVESIGGMDERFFLYWEDADLCKRLRQAGWLTYYSPDAAVIHLTGRSSEHAKTASLVAFHRSAHRYFLKHGGKAAALASPFVFLALQLRLLIALFSARFTKS